MKKVFLLLLAMLVMTGSCLAASGSEKTTFKTARPSKMFMEEIRKW